MAGKYTRGRINKMLERKDVELSGGEITKAWDAGSRSQDGKTALERIANAATNKAIKKIYNAMAFDTGNFQASPSLGFMAALKKLAEEV